MNKRAAKPSSHPQESARKAHGAATMRHTRTSTLEGSELRWRSAVYAVCAVSLALGVTFLACAFPDGASRPSTYLWVACALAFATLTASNAAYLARHPGRPTIGMMPVAVASAGAAAAPLAASATGSAAPLRTCAIVALALGVACVAVFGCLFVKMRAAYANAPAPGEKSVLIVLGAAVRSGRPCQTLARRLDVAADLLLGHPHRMAVLTGGASAARPSEPTEAEAMARYLRECGVPEAQLLLEPRAANTRQNVSFSLEVVREAGLAGRQLCVVSNDYHLWRALRCARRQGAELVPVAARTPRVSALQQWCREALTILAGR